MFSNNSVVPNFCNTNFKCSYSVVPNVKADSGWPLDNTTIYQSKIIKTKENQSINQRVAMNQSAWSEKERDPEMRHYDFLSFLRRHQNLQKNLPLSDHPSFHTPSPKRDLQIQSVIVGRALNRFRIPAKKNQSSQTCQSAQANTPERIIITHAYCIAYTPHCMLHAAAHCPPCPHRIGSFEATLHISGAVSYIRLFVSAAWHRSWHVSMVVAVWGLTP